MKTTEPDMVRFIDALERDGDLSLDWSSWSFPHFSERGQWRLLPVDERSRWNGGRYEHGNWTAGFWFGQMWLASRLTGEERFAEVARGRLSGLTDRAQDRTTHDLGFLFWPSLVLGHHLGYVGNEECKDALTAAETLTDRFNPAGGYLQAFGAIGDPRGSGTSTIDTMMNLPLLWWAGQNSTNTRFQEVAHIHALTSKEGFLRDDGSTYHLNHFEPRSGTLLTRGTFQGSASRSCWSRGQAWAVTGFAFAYAATGDDELLSASEIAAEYLWAHLPESGVPPWDFDDTSAEAPRDASAGAIAALGALVLGAIHPREGARRRFSLRGETLLTNLLDCVSESREHQGVLQQSSYSVPDGLGLKGATAWGDFYFSLALAIRTGVIPLDSIMERAEGVSHTASRVEEVS